MSTPRYTIRPVGKTAWANCKTIVSARKAAAEARDRMSDKIVIVDEKTGKLVE